MQTDGEEWRKECEIRFLLNLPNREERQAYLAKVELHRGKKARDILESDGYLAWLNKRQCLPDNAIVSGLPRKD